MTYSAPTGQFYSDNLAQEVLKGLIAKARDGGTPYQAPLGYLHKREYRGGVMSSWIEIDPERAPLIRWAFEVYATGDWTVTDLHAALHQKGLTTRPTANKPARDLSLNSLYKLLRNPYYLGVVSYQGATYEGKHQALIDTEIWLRVHRHEPAPTNAQLSNASNCCVGLNPSRHPIHRMTRPPSGAPGESVRTRRQR